LTFIRKFIYRNTLTETNSCDNLKIKEKVTFEVEITLNKCPNDLKFRRGITVQAQGIDERVYINLEHICECDCEKEIVNVNKLRIE